MTAQEAMDALEALDVDELGALNRRIGELMRERVEPCGFMWYPSYTRQLRGIRSKAKRREYVEGIISYGAYGNEPFFADANLQIAFEGIRNSLDTSRSNFQRGKKGGRGKKAGKEDGEGNGKDDEDKQPL